MDAFLKANIHQLRILGSMVNVSDLSNRKNRRSRIRAPSTSR